MRKRISKLIRTKCNLCYRREATDFPCLLLKDRHPGIENCIGPFQNHDEHQRIMHEIFQLDKKPAVDIDRAIGDAMKGRYERNKKLFDKETNEDDGKNKRKYLFIYIGEAEAGRKLSRESTAEASQSLGEIMMILCKRGFAGHE